MTEEIVEPGAAVTAWGTSVCYTLHLRQASERPAACRTGLHRPFTLFGQRCQRRTRRTCCFVGSLVELVQESDHRKVERSSTRRVVLFFASRFSIISPGYQLIQFMGAVQTAV